MKKNEKIVFISLNIILPVLVTAFLSTLFYYLTVRPYIDASKLTESPFARFAWVLVWVAVISAVAGIIFFLKRHVVACVLLGQSLGALFLGLRYKHLIESMGDDDRLGIHNVWIYIIFTVSGILLTLVFLKRKVFKEKNYEKV